MSNQFASSGDIGQGKARIFIEWRALTCPKAEYNEETTEDRCAERATAGLFAVADGVGSSFGANKWAQAVVDAWADTPFHSEEPFEVEWWLRKLQPPFVMSPQEIAALQPYAQAAARRGAGCTFLGLRLWPAKDQKSVIYSLLCAGDSVLIHYPKRAFPISDPEKFGSYPTVLRSKGFDRRQDRVLRYPVPASGQQDTGGHAFKDEPYERLRAEDTLLLCTDAIAHWALETDNWSFYHEDAEDARTQLERQTQETWPAFIEELRHKGKIVDDDTTVLFIHIAHDQKPQSAPGAGGWRRAELAAAAIRSAEESWEAARRDEMAQVLRQKPLSALEVARVFGDGWYFRTQRDAKELYEIALKGRGIARGLDKINAALRAISWDNPTSAQLAEVAELERRYGERLRAEPAAQGALTTMRDLLSRPKPPPAAPPPSPQQPAAPPASMAASPQGAGNYAPPNPPIPVEAPQAPMSAVSNQSGAGPAGGASAPVTGEPLAPSQNGNPGNGAP